VIAHIGALPLEELLPVLAGAASGLLAVRAWVMLRVRRGRALNHFMFGPDWDAGEWWERRPGECGDGSGGGRG
jgi:hypothetical protein